MGTDGQNTAGIFRELHATIVPVRDLARSLAWYRETLGLEPRRVVEGFLAVLGTGGPTNVCLYVPEEETHRDGSFPNFRTDDIQATRSHLEERDVRCTEISGGGGGAAPWPSRRSRARASECSAAARARMSTYSWFETRCWRSTIAAVTVKGMAKALAGTSGLMAPVSPCPAQ